MAWDCPGTLEAALVLSLFSRLRVKKLKLERMQAMHDAESARGQSAQRQGMREVHQGDAVDSDAVDSDDQDLYRELVQYIVRLNADVSLQESGLSVTLAAVLAIFSVAPHMAPGGDSDSAEDGPDTHLNAVSSHLELEVLMQLLKQLEVIEE